MRRDGMAALGRVVLGKRGRVIMLQPWDRGLMGTTLRNPYDIRDAKDYFEDIPNMKIEPDMIKLAEHILQRKTTDFTPSRFVDRYGKAVAKILKKKQAGRRLADARGHDLVGQHGQAEKLKLISRISLKRLLRNIP